MPQARDNLERAQEEADARFNEWAALLAKEAAEDALRVVAHEEGIQLPRGEKVKDLARSVFEEAPERDALLAASEGIDEVHDPVEVDLETASVEAREGGNVEYVRDEQAQEVIRLATRIVDACEERLR